MNSPKGKSLRGRFKWNEIRICDVTGDGTSVLKGLNMQTTDC